MTGLELAPCEQNVASQHEHQATNMYSSQWQHVELSEAQFEAIRSTVHRLCGIALSHTKITLVRSRLQKRMRALGLSSFDEYFDFVKNDRREITAMIDAITTNKTSFFRESQHFDYLRTQILPDFHRTGKTIRLWSAGCSSGEEPYSLAILMHDDLPNHPVKILATDISERVLKTAQEAVYSEESIRSMPPQLMLKHAVCVKPTHPRAYTLTDDIRSMVRFARLNLLGQWPMHGPFDVIFCRNVMIYFDTVTKERLVNRFWDLLKPGGYLFVGHSESLAALSHPFTYCQPAVYRRAFQAGDLRSSSCGM